MRNVYVICHAQSLHHVEQKVGGWYDTGLTKLGQKQAAAIARQLAEVIEPSQTALYASDLLRAAETAQSIAQACGLSIELMSDLREATSGLADGCPQQWLWERFAPPPQDDSRIDYRICDGAESRRDFATRLYRAMDNILATPKRDIIIVSHKFALTFLIAAWQKVPITNVDYLTFQAKPASITCLREDDLFCNRVLVYLCDTTHLKGLEATPS